MRNELPRKDYYGVLRLPAGSSEPIIRQRFKRLARRFHPDVNPAPDAAERFREIREAHDVLLDPVSRAQVDSWYQTQRATRPRPWRRTTPAGEPAPPFESQARPLPTSWAKGGDVAFNFGCFFVLFFVMAFLVAATQVTSAWSAIRVALGVACVVAVVAAFGGERVRERILWLLAWLWWL